MQFKFVQLKATTRSSERLTVEVFVERRLHPSQVKKQQVHAIIAVDQDPWVWRKLRNVQEIAQEGADGGKRVCYFTPGFELGDSKCKKPSGGIQC